jgi:type IV pilus assembly protein PilO
MSNLKERDVWYARVQRVLTVAMVLLVLGFYLLGYRPGASRLDSLKIQTMQKQRELSLNQSRARHLPAVSREVELLRWRLERFGRQLPRQQGLGEFLSDIERLGQAHGIRGLNIFPEAQRQDGLYCELPIRIRLEGEFLSVCAFLLEAEAMPRLTRIRQLHIRSRPGGGAGVEAILLLSIFSEA